MITEQVIYKMVAGKYRVPVTLTPSHNGKNIEFSFRYNKALMAEVKAMEGARWHGYDDPPKKVWSVKNNSRNWFQIDFLRERNPYASYDLPLLQFEYKRPLYAHQQEMVAHGLTRHYCIFAGEMGTGKTLAAIEIMERIPDLTNDQCWYVGPKSGVKAVGRELPKWDSKIYPIMYTYERLVKRMKTLLVEDCPRVVIFDECSKVKTPTAQRSQACLALAETVRERWGKDGYCVLMSGTPAPKVPTDWWHQCEVARPGYIREGNIHKFKQRLCIIEERESITGGVYPHVVTWLDDTDKCKHCGQPSVNHFEANHPFENSKNEVGFLYERMKGLVLVTLKKDCLDLPEKQYEIIRVKPTPETLRAAKLIKQSSRRAIQALTLMRELSDGFQYQEEDTGEKEKCPACHGAKELTVRVPKEDVDIMAPQMVDDKDFMDKLVPCDNCGGNGEVHKYFRATHFVPCPKDQYFIDELDAHEEIGRYVVWGGFTGTIDKLCKIAIEQGWTVLRVDGRGFMALEAPNSVDADEDILLDCMDGSHPNKLELLEKYPKVCFVGHPQAGGMALTLHASPTELFFSNAFSGEARMQAEDRIHRIGMDKNRGATVKDLIHLPSDQLVLDNLKKKKRLQSLTMGDLEDAFKTTTERII